MKTTRSAAAVVVLLLLSLLLATSSPAAAQLPSAANKKGGSQKWSGEMAFATVMGSTQIDILTITPTTTQTPRTLIAGSLNAHPAYSSPSASLIAFSGKHDGDASFQVYTADADNGSNSQHPITAPHGYSMVPGFSCSGKKNLKVVFEGVRGDDTVTQAFLINADGTGNASRIWANPGVQQVGPKFSLNCKQLVFAQATNNGSTQDLFLLDVGIADNATYTFTNLRQLTFGAHNDFSRSWSPDGKQIVFNNAVDGIGQLFIISVKTGKLRQLTFNDGAFPAFSPGAPFPDLRGDVTPAWSPDSKWVAFCRQKAAYAGDAQGTYQVYVVDACARKNGAVAEPVALTNLTTQSVTLAWRAVRSGGGGGGGGKKNGR